MQVADTFLNFFNSLPPEVQNECRATLTGAAPLPVATKKATKRPEIRREHQPNKIKETVIVENGTTYYSTNPQAGKFA